jgi:SAM-dependent methyltransferase
MHPTVFATFDRLCAAHRCDGDVLEIGAMPSPDTLLCLPALRHARRRVGVNLDGPATFGDIEIRRGNANDLRGIDGFDDGSFDMVLCNSMLEHDPYFWKTLAEMRRLVRPGGVIGIGVPGYVKLPLERRVAALTRLLSRIGVSEGWLERWRASTLTLQVHNFPSDYYRFSAAAMADVLLEGLVATELHTLMVPPRLIGFGVKPAR